MSTSNETLLQLIVSYGALRYRSGCSTPETSQALAKESHELLTNIGMLIATLEASVAANQKDAERYRWVRDGLGCDVRSREEYLTGEELDAAIDSSIAPDTSTQEVG